MCFFCGCGFFWSEYLKRFRWLRDGGMQIGMSERSDILWGYPMVIPQNTEKGEDGRCVSHHFQASKKLQRHLVGEKCEK